jgi:hypothetical protein
LGNPCNYRNPDESLKIPDESISKRFSMPSSPTDGYFLNFEPTPWSETKADSEEVDWKFLVNNNDLSTTDEQDQPFVPPITPKADEQAPVSPYKRSLVAVPEVLLPIYNQLKTIHKCLLEVEKLGGVSSSRELYPYSMKVSIPFSHNFGDRLI